MTLRIDARGRDSRGRVVEIVPSSDPATRTVVVRVHLDDTRDIVPGMFGRLLIPSAPEQVLTVSASAVIRAGQLTMMDIVDQGRVQRRTVQLGRAIGDRFEVLSGLAAGEAVVLRNANARPREGRLMSSLANPSPSASSGSSWNRTSRWCSSWCRSPRARSPWW